MTTKTETDLAPDRTAAASEVRQHAKAVNEDLRGLGRATKEVAQEKMGDAKQKATEYYEQGKKKASEFEDQIESYVRQKPLKSVLIAAGVGILLGFLLSRR